MTRALLAAILGRVTDGSSLAGHDANHALATAEAEGVVALIADRLHEMPAVPEAWRTAFAARARHLATLDLVHEASLREVVDAFAAGNIGALLMKGAALAYSHYARPDLRPRLDADLLVPRWARERSQAILEELGYRPADQQDGDVLMYQRCFVRRRQQRSDTVDLHWRALNPHVFADVLGYRELEEHAASIPALGRGARGLSHAHALVLACVHRVAHHAMSPRLIWIHDIHLLATHMRAADWQLFLATADREGVGPLCRNGLEEAVATFGTTLPRGLLADHRLPANGDDPRAAYLNERRHAAIVFADFKAIGNWSARARLASQYLFPGARYMRTVYAPGTRLPLAALYAIRLWRGLRRSMAPPPAPRGSVSRL